MIHYRCVAPRCHIAGEFPHFSSLMESCMTHFLRSIDQAMAPIPNQKWLGTPRNIFWKKQLYRHFLKIYQIILETTPMQIGEIVHQRMFLLLK